MTVSLIDRQRRSFDQLVDDGVYSQEFEHAPEAKAFVGAVLATVAARLEPGRTVTVLDCGCGTGAWLAFLSAALCDAGFDQIRLCGFDLSGKMVEVARQKLAGVAEPQDLRAGNVLDEASYDLPSGTAEVDLLFAYDVVQQLPRRQQYRACEIMADHLAPGGLALIFDNDSLSKFGRRMGLRKFLTRYFGLSLVPRYYCNASYPPLERFRQKLASAGWGTTVQVRPDQIKRALVVERSGDLDDAAKPRGATLSP